MSSPEVILPEPVPEGERFRPKGDTGDRLTKAADVVDVDTDQKRKSLQASLQRILKGNNRWIVRSMYHAREIKRHVLVEAGEEAQAQVQQWEHSLRLSRGKNLVPLKLRNILTKKGKFSEAEVQRFVEMQLDLFEAKKADIKDVESRLSPEDAMLLGRVREFMKVQKQFKKGFAAGMAVGTAVGVGAILDGDEVDDEDVEELEDEGRVIRSAKKGSDGARNHKSPPPDKSSKPANPFSSSTKSSVKNPFAGGSNKKSKNPFA